jgi:signal transduction histidine kinase
VPGLDLKFFKQLVDESFLGVVVLERASEKSVYINAMAREILAIEGESISLKELLPMEARAGERVLSRELMEMEGTFQDITVRKSNGDSFIALVSFGKIDDRFAVLRFQDITFQKKLQREVMTKQAEINQVIGELRKQNQDLMNIDKAKDRFFAVTSHELRTPLSSIVATAQFVHDGLCTDPKEVLSYMDVILSEGRHLLEIINDILDFSKIQAGKFECYVEQQDIVGLIKERMAHIRNFAQTKTVRVVGKALKSPRKAYFDVLRMTQVLDNVLSNAIKFNKAQGTVTISIDCERVADHVTVVIKDTGEGIPADQIDKVFNEFETIENIRNHHKGTGLGMPICKRLMEAIGGRIYFESSLGKGTVFYLQIPTKKVLPEGAYQSRPLAATRITG